MSKAKFVLFAFVLVGIFLGSELQIARGDSMAPGDYIDPGQVKLNPGTLNYGSGAAKWYLWDFSTVSVSVPGRIIINGFPTRYDFVLRNFNRVESFSSTTVTTQIIGLAGGRVSTNPLSCETWPSGIIPIVNSSTYPYYYNEVYCAGIIDNSGTPKDAQILQANFKIEGCALPIDPTCSSKRELVNFSVPVLVSRSGPDLFVSWDSYNAQYISPTSTIYKLGASVKNQGDATAGPSVLELRVGSATTRFNAGSLAPGQKQAFVANISLPVGLYPDTGVADVTNIVTEVDERNNISERPSQSQIPPLKVSIVSPTASSSYATATSSISLGMLISGNNGTTTFTWYNARDNAKGNAVPTKFGLWALNIPLVSGPNYIFVDAIDSSRIAGTGYITVIKSGSIALENSPSTVVSDDNSSSLRDLASVLNSVQTFLQELSVKVNSLFR